jgi:hypothetical protein
MTKTEAKMLEADVEKYWCELVFQNGGIQHKLKYLDQDGAADRIAFFPHNRIFLVELKRPKGGRIRQQQMWDAQNLLQVGVLKEFLYTKHMCDMWIKRVCPVKSGPLPPFRVHDQFCICEACIPF